MNSKNIASAFEAEKCALIPYLWFTGNEVLYLLFMGIASPRRLGSVALSKLSKEFCGKHRKDHRVRNPLFQSWLILNRYPPERI